jgi:segregation and condensation protein B
MPDEAADRLKPIVESVLFVADEPVEVAALARVTGAGVDEVERAIDALAADCRERGVRVQRTEGAVQMVSAPEARPYVESFLGVDEDDRLSHAALETLAIIAYKQPVTRQRIERIRGLNCDRALATLRARGLVAEVGRAETVGRPYLFGTTFRFLEHFGLEKPEDLPPLEEGGRGKEEGG